MSRSIRPPLFWYITCPRRTGIDRRRRRLNNDLHRQLYSGLVLAITSLLARLSKSIVRYNACCMLSLWAQDTIVGELSVKSYNDVLRSTKSRRSSPRDSELLAPVISAPFAARQDP
jgi:hypothetical protein